MAYVSENNKRSFWSRLIADFQKASESPIGSIIGGIQIRSTIAAGNFVESLRGRVVMTFVRAAKELPGYKSLRPKTTYAKIIAQHNLQASDYDGLSLQTNSRGKHNISKMIENPIICFPGQGGFSDDQEAVSVGQYVAKILKPALPTENFRSTKQRILSFGYKNVFPEDLKLSCETEEAFALKLLQDPHYCGPQAERFVQDFFESRVLDISDDGTPPATLPPDVLARRMRMTLVGYSLGGGFVRQVLNGLEQMMHKHGYTKNEINRGVSNIFVLSIAGNEPIRNPHATTGVEVIDVGDPMACSFVQDYYYHPGHFGAYKRTTGPNSDILWTQHSHEGIEISKDTQSSIKAGHTSRLAALHVSIMKMKDFLPEGAINALVNSVMEERKLPSLDDMYDFDVREHKPEKILGQDTSGYAIYESDVLLALAEDENALEIVESVHFGTIEFKDGKAALAEKTRELFSTLSKNKSQVAAGIFIQRIRTALDPVEPSHDVEIREAQIA